MHQQGQTPIRSDDGRWEWDGQAWRPLAEPPAPGPPPPTAERDFPMSTWATSPGTLYRAAPARGGGVAVVSLILGIVSLIAWLFPLLGVPVAAGGLICGILGRRSTRRGMAVAGLVMSVIGLVLGVGNAILGVVLRLSGAVS
jgi:hypothetical protein